MAVPETLVALLQHRSRNQPDEVAFSFLEGGTRDTAVEITYAELDRRARAIAASLVAVGGQGARAVLLYPPGVDYIAALFGCFYGNVTAVPAYPPDPQRLQRTLPRLQTIVNNAHASIVLTNRLVYGMATGVFQLAPELQQRTWLMTDALPPGVEAHWKFPEIDAASTAILQYTSGSTGTPRGVVLTHGNLLDNQTLIARAFGSHPRSVVVGWLPLYHDMGLIGNVLHPLFSGCRCILMSPAQFLARPIRWLEAISSYRATISGGPNFAYDLCVRKITDEERAPLDLSSWLVAFNGAEPVRATTLGEFSRRFAPQGFRTTSFFPCYGLAEASLIVTAGQVQAPPRQLAISRRALTRDIVDLVPDDADALVLIGVGAALGDQRLEIVASQTCTPCPPGAVGEIWVSGSSVGRGYYGDHEHTEQTFRARLATGDETDFLRTGDLGFLHDGELFITGRSKDLIIIHGRNHYPQDIERTIEDAQIGLRRGCSAAFAVDVEGEERLVVAAELAAPFPPLTADASHAAIAGALRRRLLEHHEVALHALVLLPPGTIHKTSSGKIQRRACRQSFLDRAWAELYRVEARAIPAAELAAPGADEPVIAAFARILGVAPASLDVAIPVTSMGLDSIRMIELQHALQVEAGLDVPLGALLGGATIASLSEHPIRVSQRPEAGPAVQIFPLSEGQRALWYLEQLGQGSAYHVARAVELGRPVVHARLEAALDALVAWHPSLRTTFFEHDGVPRQRVHQVLAPACSYRAFSSEEARQRFLAAEVLRPFDLRQGPLVRCLLCTADGKPDVLALIVHHIVIDFWSCGILLRQLGALLGDAPPVLGAPGLTYADHVRWQADLLRSPAADAHRAYWRDHLGAPLEPVWLPFDRSPADGTAPAGARLSVDLSEALHRSFKALAEAHGVTLFTAVLAVFVTWLRRSGNDDEFVIGTTVAGRSQAAFAEVIGYFVNPVPLRIDLRGNPSFAELLVRLGAVVRGALAHADLPFPMIVEHVQPRREAGRSPLFEVMCSHLAPPASLGAAEGLSALVTGCAGIPVHVGGIDGHTAALPPCAAQFDLSVTVVETSGRLLVLCDYRPDRFEPATVERMLERFVHLAEAASASPASRILELDALTDEDRAELARWNDTAVDYPRDGGLHTLVEAQAARTPDATAVSFEGASLSYRALDQRANNLAHRLRAQGIGPEVLVGVAMERSLELVVALLAILKAGGAYVPLDLEYPAARLAFMLDDARAPVLLTQQRLVPRLPPHDAKVLCVDAEGIELDRGGPAASWTIAASTQAAYVIYTSGSTGRPKGVINTHEAIVNRLQWMQRAYRLTDSDRVLQKTTFSFDVSVWELFWPLVTGARLVMARPGGHRDSRYLTEVIQAEGVTTMHFVPSMLSEFLEEPGVVHCSSLQRVICSGEALPLELQDRFFKRVHRAELYNLYGPTEAAIDVTSWRCERGSRRRTVPIGRPIANVEIHVLDSEGRLVAPGTPGELCIGGIALARGYLRRPGLTAERWVPDGSGRSPGARLYRTGDRARWLSDGVIEYLGRLDHQVKLRGFRIELGEIEAELARYPGVRDVAVTVRDDCVGGPQLVAHVVADSTLRSTPGALRAHLVEKLPGYMVPARFVMLDAMPLTPTGKVDRKALPAPQDDADAQSGPPRTPLEHQLAMIWCEVLGRDHVGRDDDFFALGGHSLLALRVRSRVREALQLDLPLARLFAQPTIAELAAALVASQDPAASTPVLRSDMDDATASFAQQRLWIQDQLHPGLPLYHIAGGIRMRGPLDVACLERAVDEVVRRHASLRTTFSLVDGRLAQEVRAASPGHAMELTDLTTLPVADRQDEEARLLATETRRPFDLARGPLFRLRLVQRGPEEHLLVVVLHHVIADGWSLGLLLGELAELYGAYASGRPPRLATLRSRYTEFAQWERAQLTPSATAALIAFWRRELADVDHPSELPHDRARSASGTIRGASLPFRLPEPVAQQVIAKARAHRLTPFMIQAAAFALLLHRYTGDDDIVVGTNTANRDRPGFEAIIGNFANTVVLRLRLGAIHDVAALLVHTRDVVLNAYSHQALPFDKLVEALAPHRDWRRHPFFNIMITANSGVAPVQAGELRLEPFPIDTGIAKCDLTLYLDDSDGLAGWFEYDADLFDAATVARLARHYLELLDQVAGCPAMTALEELSVES